ncbi:MAG: M48 family metallopeptidase [Endomicrobiia bacterium]
MNIKTKIFRRNVKYPRIEIKNFETRVILPLRYNVPADVIINKYRAVLEEKYKYINEVEKISRNLRVVVNENFIEDIKTYLEEFSKKLNISYKSIVLRKMRKSWASCTKNNVLVFNKNLKFLPKELLKYVVCHEVCHLLEKKHNENFYKLLNRFYKDHIYYTKLLDAYFVLLRK